MELLKTVAEMRAFSRSAKAQGQRVALVPTMGFLHEGHLALVKEAARRADTVIVSIFVNPLQFGPSEDLAQYPRDLETDLAKLSQLPVAAVFAPSEAEIYPEGAAAHRTTVQVSGLTTGLCGASRPGHFTGVATVVTKLFHIVEPDLACFGQKDAQQLAVIQRLVTDLNLAIEIVPVPIVREADGLALSSRNTYLSPAERQAALCLHRALKQAEALQQAGQTPSQVEAALTDLISQEPLARIDYIQVVDASSLQPATDFDRPALVALAVYIGRTRLIDNCLLTTD